MSGFGDFDPRYIIAIIVTFIVAITVHEFMHAWTAFKLGDPTARDLGRITLNPMSHFEPFGFFGMVMISIGFPFIGWGKPVPVNPSRFTHEFALHRKRGMALVAAAGPLSNVAQALVMAIPFQLWLRGTIQLNDGTALFIEIFIYVNVLLASFNMIPIPPLDGGNVLLAVLPRPAAAALDRMRPFGFLLLYALMLTGTLSAIMIPVRNTVLSWLL